jgi:hypothetical protein
MKPSQGGGPVSDHHDNHGQTPAAWTAVIIIVIGFILGTVAVVIGNWLLFWIGGVGLVVVGGVTGKVMAMAGMGAKPKSQA